MTKTKPNLLILLIDFLVPVAILIGAIVGMRALILSKPEVPRIEREAPPVFVETISVPETAPRVWITAYGSVEPAREVALRPQVGGVVVDQNSKLIAGGLIGAGERLLKIDPRDYENALQQREASLASARAALQMEEGRRIVAQREWELLESTLPTTPESRDLALRVPIYEEKLAAVRAAESQLAQARLDLERTELRAPFNAMVISETVEVGQSISPQGDVARLVGSDAVYVDVSVPSRYLGWIRVPGAEGGEAARVELTKELEAGLILTREGRVAGLLGDVDPNGRMARLRIELSDPFGLKTETPMAEPFLVGDYVRARIEGPVLDHALEIPRVALREDDRVWVMSPEARLEVRDVEVLHRQEDTVILHGGVAAGERIVVSNLPEAVPGMALAIEETTP